MTSATRLATRLTPRHAAVAVVATSVVLFVVAFFMQFPAWLVTVIIAAMAIGSLVLAPAIVIGYGVKAADADDRGEKFGY